MFDGMAWLVQIVLFLTLGLLVFPSSIVPIIGIGLLISLFLIVVAIPIGVLISLAPFRMPMRRRAYISWVGLRGAVPIVFATYPLITGIDKADMIFNIVFFISVTSIMIQGTTLSIVAKWLRVALPESKKQISAVEKFVIEIPKALMREIKLQPGNQGVNHRIIDLNFPGAASIVMINRDDQYLRPNGTTILQGDDLLYVLADDEATFEEVTKTLI